MATHRGEACVKVKAEIWVMRPQAKDAWSPKKLEGTRKYPILEPSKGALTVGFSSPERAENKVLLC